MRRTSTGVALGLALVLGVGAYQVGHILHAADAPVPMAPHGGGGHQSLENDMERMGKAFKKLSAQVKDATQNAASLALVDTLQQGATAAKGMVPKMAGSVAADKRDKFIADYKDMMDGLLEQLKDLKQQLTDGKNDQAADTVASIKEIMDQGHKDFRKKEGGGGGGSGDDD